MSEYEIFLIPRKNIIRLSNEDILMSKDWMKTFLECVSNIKKTGKEEDYILCYCFQKNSFLYYRNEEESVLSHFIFDDLEEEKKQKVIIIANIFYQEIKLITNYLKVNIEIKVTIIKNKIKYNKLNTDLQLNSIFGKTKNKNEKNKNKIVNEQYLKLLQNNFDIKEFDSNNNNTKKINDNYYFKNIFLNINNINKKILFSLYFFKDISKDILLKYQIKKLFNNLNINIKKTNKNKRNFFQMNKTKNKYIKRINNRRVKIKINKIKRIFKTNKNKIKQ